jgi:hypothetical protein
MENHVKFGTKFIRNLVHSISQAVRKVIMSTVHATFSGDFYLGTCEAKGIYHVGYQAVTRIHVVLGNKTEFHLSLGTFPFNHPGLSSRKDEGLDVRRHSPVANYLSFGGKVRLLKVGHVCMSSSV